MMVAPVVIEGQALSIGTLRSLFKGDYVSGMCCGHSHDVADNSARFVMIKGDPESERRLNVELHALDRLSNPRSAR